MSNSPSPAITVREASGGQRTALDRPGRSHGPLRRALRNTLHYLSYHFVLKRPKSALTLMTGLNQRSPVASIPTASGSATLRRL